MADNFPTLSITKAALAAPLSKPAALLKTTGILALATLIPLAYAASEGLSFEIVEQLANPENAELATQYGGAILLTYLIGSITLGPALAYVFNFWVRFGALGPEGTAFPTPGAAISSTLINMLKFVLIFILLGIALVVAVIVMGAVGLGPGFTELGELGASGDVRAVTLATLLPSIIYLIIICVIYSLFSANLTQTALKSNREGLEHPHTIDFAIVLFLLYLVVFVPATLAGLIGSVLLANIINWTVGVYIGYSVAVAHGLRYRMCIPAEEEIFL